MPKQDQDPAEDPSHNRTPGPADATQLREETVDRLQLLGCSRSGSVADCSHTYDTDTDLSYP